MNRRQYLKRLKKALLKYRKHKGKKFYTFRGVDENGVFTLLGFTVKPKQKYCKVYNEEYITEVRHYSGKRANTMFSVFNVKYESQLKEI